MRMSPDVICSNPAIMRKVVVLPQPDGPSSTTNSPSLISIDTSATTAELPNDLVMCWRVMLICKVAQTSVCVFNRGFSGTYVNGCTSANPLRFLSAADDHLQSAALLTKPAFTGLFSMYRTMRKDSAGSRLQ